MAAPGRRPDAPLSLRLLLIAASIVAASGGLLACQAIQLTAPISVGPDDWTSEGGSCRHRHVSSDTLSDSLVEVWDYDPRAAFGPGSPLVAGGQLVVSTRRGEVHLIDLASGDVTGRDEFGSSVEGVPALSEQTLFVPVAGEHAGVTAYDLLAGRRMWRWEGAPVVGALCLGDSLVYAADARGRITALSATDGSVRWQHEPDSSVTYLAGPAATSDRLIAVDDRGLVLALDPASGEMIWRRELGEPVERTPAVYRRRLIVPTASGVLAALRVEDGRTVWTYQTESDLVRFSSPAAGSDRIVVGGSDGRVRAMDARDGTLIWTRRIAGPVVGAPVLTASHVVVGAMDEHLYLLDPFDGRVRWSQTVGGRVKSAPLVHDGTVIALAEPSHVFAFRDTARTSDRASSRDARASSRGGLGVR